MALPPILPAPRRGTTGAQKAQQQQKSAAAAYQGPANPKPVYVPPPSLSPQQHGGGTDIQSSGANYGSGQANRYKQTPAYKQAVAQVFRQQPTLQKAAIIRGLIHNNAFNTPEFHAIHDQWLHLPTTEMSTISQHIPNEIGKFISPEKSASLGKIVDTGLGAIGDLGSAATKTAFGGDTSNRTVNPRTGVSQEGLSAGNLAAAPIKMGIDVVRAGLQQPKVLPNTLKGLGETAIGAIPGIIEGVQHPVKTIEAMAHDYSTRWGPVIQGNDQAAINRIKNSPQGAAPEVLDALGILGGADATVGRAVTDLARTREALTGAKPGFLTRARPALRVSGSATREQQLARGAMKITAQRAEDKIRQVLAGKGEIKPHAGEVTPIFGRRAQRIDVSGVASRTRTVAQNLLNREVRSGKGSAQGNIARLGKWEKKAFPHVVEGHIPLRSGPKAAVDAINNRIAQITSHRLANAQSFGNRIPLQFAHQVDELRMLGELKANVGKWLTPKLAAAVDREGARAVRIEGKVAEVNGLHPSTAEARRLRPQGEALGIEHPYDRLETKVAALKQKEAKIAATIRNPGTVGELQAARQAISRIHNNIRDLQSPEMGHLALSQYSQEVRAAAKKAGLPAEPAYFHHQPHPRTDFGAYTTGAGHAAMPAFKRSTFSLYKGGAVDRSLQAYVDGLAHSIKLPHQWRLVDEQVRRAIVNPSAEAIHRALGQHKSVNDLTGFELQQALWHDGIDPKNVRFIRPGRLEAQTLHKFEDESQRLTPEVASAAGRNAPTPLEESPHFYDALKQHEISQPGNTGDQNFLSGAGVRAVPNSVYKELLAGTHPSGGVARMWGKLQGLTGAMILAGSPSFVIMNTLAEGLTALASTRGKLFKDMLDYPMWMRSLAPAERQAFHEKVRAYSGSRNYFRTDKLGSTAQGDLARSWRELQHHGIMRLARAANPVAVLFHTQDAFSNTFRHAAFYSQIKRQALVNIGKETGQAARWFETANHAMRLTPNGKLGDAIRGEMNSLPALEQAGRHVLEALGDYTRYTAAERRLLNNRAVLFYGFLRYATKTLLYTLPMHHPIITGLVGELGKLHNDEVRKLLGGVDLPWAYSRLFFKGKNGKLTSIDTLRSSPVGSTVTDVTTQGIRGLSGTVLPEVGLLLDQIYGADANGSPVPRNIYSLLNGYLSMSYPYRALTQAHFGLHSQQADSVPFIHERPTTHKTKSAQQYQAAKEQASGPLDQKMLGSLLGLYPKPDNSQVIAAHRAQLAASKGRKRGRPAGSGSGGGLGGGGLGGGGLSGGGLSGGGI